MAVNAIIVRKFYTRAEFDEFGNGEYEPTAEQDRAAEAWAKEMEALIRGVDPDAQVVRGGWPDVEYNDGLAIVEYKLQVLCSTAAIRTVVESEDLTPDVEAGVLTAFGAGSGPVFTYIGPLEYEEPYTEVYTAPTDEEAAEELERLVREME